MNDTFYGKELPHDRLKNLSNKQVETNEHFMLKMHLKNILSMTEKIVKDFQDGKIILDYDLLSLTLKSSLASEYLKSLEDE